ncbi:Rv0361 family membrane protein [Mycolicibacterium sp. Dal123E01]|uniref:Rv0361 family membrane protein n=1 Tax=Mycolicibacterium sp. Dal123E01 TaxID=3457578 RepID=UPI00403EE073
MSNPSGPDHDDATEPVVGSDGEPPTQEHDPATEIIGATDSSPERRYTAPGFDAGSTQIIHREPDPATEIFSTPTEVFPVSGPPRTGPQAIPARPAATRRRSWALVLAVIAVIAALAAVAILVTVLLTRDSSSKASQEDMVRSTIQSYDAAVQNGDLAALRGITCGQTRDSYVKYDDQAWSDTHARVTAARQYPVVASVDQIVVNGDHAEANVTSFMAFDPATRSTRSFDLQFRDNQWKICQAS